MFLTPVGVSETGTSGQADTAEEVGLDQTHPKEASIQYHTPSPDLEPTGGEKDRLTSQQLRSLMAYAPPGVMGISK